MSAGKLNTYYIGINNLNNFITVLDYQLLGLFELSLSNYTNNNLPAIESGSIIEVNGNMYYFSADDSISGAPANGTVYIKLVVSGALQVSPEFTATDPAWDAEKCGWYDGNDRYIAKMIKSSSTYYNKVLMNKEKYDEI